MAKLPVHGPFDEGDLHHDLRTHPVRADARQPDRPGEWRFSDFDRIELRTELSKHLGIEARADLSGKDKIAVFEIADEHCAEPHASALWIGKSTDDEFLRGFAFHLQP